MIALVNFTTDINLGNIIMAASVIVALYGFHVANVKRITIMESRVAMMWNVFKKRFNISDREEQEELKNES